MKGSTEAKKSMNNSSLTRQLTLLCAFVFKTLFLGSNLGLPDIIGHDGHRSERHASSFQASSGVGRRIGVVGSRSDWTR